MDELLTARQAADLLHLHVKRVQALARSGRLPAVRTGRKWLFPRDRLLASLRGAREPAGAAGAAGAAAPRRTPRAGARTGGLDISARNQLRARILGIVADGIMAEVRLQIGDQELTSIITRSSAERLGLAVGDEVLAVIKSTEVMVGRDARGR